MTGLPALATAATGLLAFFVTYLIARTRRTAEAGATRSARSLAGIFVQGAAFALACAGGGRVALDPLGAPALLEAAGVAILMAAAVTLFAWATRTMGRNWSVVARTRQDHALVVTGPFAHVRHPIYVALLLLMVGTSVALGTAPRLLVAIPLYALRTMFGEAYDAYAARVPRFVPGLF